MKPDLPLPPRLVDSCRDKAAAAYARKALELRNRAVHHEQRANHFQLQEIRLREGL